MSTLLVARRFLDRTKWAGLGISGHRHCRHHLRAGFRLGRLKAHRGRCPCALGHISQPATQPKVHSCRSSGGKKTPRPFRRPASVPRRGAATYRGGRHTGRAGTRKSEMRSFRHQTLEDAMDDLKNKGSRIAARSTCTRRMRSSIGPRSSAWTKTSCRRRSPRSATQPPQFARSWQPEPVNGDPCTSNL